MNLRSSHHHETWKGKHADTPPEGGKKECLCLFVWRIVFWYYMYRYCVHQYISCLSILMNCCTHLKNIHRWWLIASINKFIKDFCILLNRRCLTQTIFEYRVLFLFFLYNRAFDALSFLPNIFKIKEIFLNLFDIWMEYWYQWYT